MANSFKTIIKNNCSETHLRRIIEYSILIFLFLQPFTRHTATIRAVSLISALAAWLLLLYLYPQSVWKKNPLNPYLLLYALIAAGSVFISCAPEESLRALKSNLFYQAALYLILVNTIESRRQIRRLLLVLTISFSILSLQGIIESIPVGLKYYSYEYKKIYPRAIDGYALLACFYWPLTLGALLWEAKLGVKNLLTLSLLAQTLIIYLYETRIALIVCLLSAFFALLTTRRYKTLLVCLAVSAFSGIILGVSRPKEMGEKIARYASIFSRDSYITQNGSFAKADLQDEQAVKKLLQAGILYQDRNIIDNVCFVNTIEDEKQLIQSLNLNGIALNASIITAWRSNYRNKPGLSGRRELWLGAWQVIRARFWLGYGYNPKIFSRAAGQSRFLEKWRRTLPTLYKDMTSNHPHSNPHNQFLSLLLEMGLIGLLIFLLFWGNFLLRLVKKLKQIKPDRDRVMLYAVIFTPVLAFFTVNLMNSLWNGAAGKLIIVIIVLGALFLNDGGFLPDDSS
ncbi:MAG: O-antigen ligase family protein [Candidatus Schekmanbacteria bacterium]|nr:O-antigen ligase family protein [Candidatus Schekmanbacteria bacterium]